MTKLVIQMAEIFNLKLGKNWQSNLSKSINKRNLDYIPEIFENVKKGFAKYRDRQLNKKKNKKHIQVESK